MIGVKSTASHTKLEPLPGELERTALFDSRAPFPQPWQLLKIEEHGGVTVAGIHSHRIYGPFVDELERELLALNAPGGLVLDFSQVMHFTSDLVSRLEAFHEGRRSSSKPLVFAGVAPDGAQVIKLCSPALKKVERFDTASDAIDALTGRLSAAAKEERPITSRRAA